MPFYCNPLLTIEYTMQFNENTRNLKALALSLCTLENGRCPFDEYYKNPNWRFVFFPFAPSRRRTGPCTIRSSSSAARPTSRTISCGHCAGPSRMTLPRTWTRRKAAARRRTTASCRTLNVPPSSWTRGLVDDCRSRSEPENSFVSMCGLRKPFFLYLHSKA